MTQALNFTTHAIADMTLMAEQAPNEYRRKGFEFIAGLLRRAEIFVLPDRGELFDRSKPYPQVAASIFKPAFPVVALEYRAHDAAWTPNSLLNCVPSSRRIALAWEWDGRLPMGAMHTGEPEAGSAVAMASIIYYDHLQRWVPIVASVLARYDAGYCQSDNHALQSELIRCGKITAKQAGGLTLDTRDVLPLVPDLLTDLIATCGPAEAFNAISADLMDEINAYRDLCLALACTNVSMERNAQPERLNRARIKAGKLPLKDFHILHIGGGGEFGRAGGGSGAGARSHLRRGHVRRLSAERITWVNSCMVKGSRPGFVDKQYSVSPLNPAAA